MSYRKRFRKSPPAQDAPSGPSGPAVPVAATGGPSAASQGNASADTTAMARSPASSVACSVPDNSSVASRDSKDGKDHKEAYDSRYASFRASKSKTRSWYGSWPRPPKSEASTQLAKETILGDTSRPSSAADFSRFGTRKADDASDSSSDIATLPRKKLSRPPISQLTVGLQQQQQEQQANGHSAKEPPIPAKADDKPQPKARDTTQTTAAQPIIKTPDTPKVAAASPPAASNAAKTAKTANTANTAAQPVSPPTEPDQEAAAAAPPTETANPNETTPAAAPAAGWFSWLSKSVPAEESTSVEPEAAMAPASHDSPAAAGDKASNTKASPAAEGDGAQQTAVEPSASQQASGNVWSYFWSNSANEAASAATDAADDKNKTAASESKDAAAKETLPTPIPVPGATSAGSDSTPVTASAGATWAFWSRDARSKSVGKTDSAGGSPEEGEIAVIGERSEAHPKPAMGVEVKEVPSRTGSVKEPPAKDAAASKKNSKKARPETTDTEDSTPGTPTVSKADANAEAKADSKAGSKTEQPGKGEASSTKQAVAKQAQAALTKATTTLPNMLLPSFDSTYSYKENPSIIRQIAHLFLRTQQEPAKHAYRTKDVPQFKKAVAIGVHGLFPAAFLRPMIGQPTGTSIRFANHCADAVRRWADSHGCEDCEIEKIALEGEGKIADRVENLWKLLLNWIDHVRNADLVVVACHSQGVPVAFMLLAKLIDLGIVTTARVGVCAMAGVSLGPFPEYKSGLGILMGSAAELWEFSNPDSEVSKRYEAALKTALEYGVRITFVGSIDDQVVPLVSAVNSPVSHPYIYRAVFVDRRIHAPDFIAHLIGFACKLRNLGVSDHGLIRELSIPLAGSLYKGEGHSRIYFEPQVYDLAVAHTLETDDVGTVPCEVRKHEGLVNPNPYHLPWIMRGLLEEDFVKTDLHAETAELVKQYDDWKPTTKALKDVKYRLEAVRSKL